MDENNSLQKALTELRDVQFEMDQSIQARTNQNRREAAIDLALNFFGNVDVTLYDVLEAAKHIDFFLQEGAIPPALTAAAKKHVSLVEKPSGA